MALWKQISLQNIQEEFTTFWHCCIGNSWDWCSLGSLVAFPSHYWWFLMWKNHSTAFGGLSSWLYNQLPFLMLSFLILIIFLFSTDNFTTSFSHLTTFKSLLSYWVNTWPYKKLHAALPVPWPNILIDHHICSTWKTHLHSHILNLVIPQDILTLR